MGFLNRDGPNGARPMADGYFEAGIEEKAVHVAFHAPGPVKRTSLKCPGFEGDVYAPHGHAFPIKRGMK